MVDGNGINLDIDHDLNKIIFPQNYRDLKFVYYNFVWRYRPFRARRPPARAHNYIYI